MVPVGRNPILPWFGYIAVSCCVVATFFPTAAFCAGSPAVDGIWSRPTLSASPPARYGRMLHYDGTRHRAVLFGGYNTNETWVLDLANPTAWQLLPVKGALPIARGDAASVYDPVNDRLWIWGGRHSSGAVYGEPAYLQFTDAPGESANWVAFNAEREPGTGNLPTPRFGSATTYDPAGQRMIFYGGGFGNQGLATNGTWALSLDALPTWDFLPQSSPYTNGGLWANLFIHPIQNQLVMNFIVTATNWWQFPYYFTKNIYTASLDGSSGWDLLSQTGGDSLDYYGQETCYHPLQDRIISITDSYLRLNLNVPDYFGTWEFRFSSGSWTHLYPIEGPGALYADDIIYDPLNDRMLVINSFTTEPAMETWFLSWAGISAVEEPGTTGRRLAAGLPRPNPSFGAVWIPLEVSEASTVGALVLDAQGRRVRDLGSHDLPPGPSGIGWDGRTDRGLTAAPGVYFVRLADRNGGESTVVRVIRADSGR